MKHAISLLLAGLALILPTSSQAQSVVKDGQPRYVQTRLIPEFEAVREGQTLTFAIDQQIEDHWHVYWQNPGDSGEALNVKWTMPDDFVAGDLQWAAPTRIAIGPLLNFGYSNHNTVLVDVTVPDAIGADEITIRAQLEWLVCEEICVPEATTIDLSLPVAKPGQDVTATDPAFFAKARAAVPQPVDWPGMLEEQDGAMLLNFQLEADDVSALSGASQIEFYPDEWGVILNAAAQENTVTDNTLTLKLRRDTRSLQELDGQITGIVAYVDASSARRSVRVQVALPASPAVVKELAQQTLQQESGSAAPMRLSLAQALGLALLGGLVLNLMPCVFPVLSMKALSLVKMSESEQSHAVTHGLMYTLGILITFSLIAAGLMSLQAAGSQIGWGFQLQNPVVVLVLAYLLFLLGLNLSGMYEIGSSRISNIGGRLSQKQGYAGSFFTGMLATVVATPCTAPFMGAAMGYAITQSSGIALSIFCALGFGLALPYLLLTMIPALRRALPRPGPWMETFRQFLAFPMYASTAWLVWVYSQQIDGVYGIMLAGMGLVFIAMGIWLWKNAPLRQPGKILIRAVSLASFGLAAAIALLSMGHAPQTDAANNPVASQTIQHSGDWHPYTKVALDDALKGNDPVFVNMTASWCITCKVNERVALATDDTQALFKEKKVMYFIGDWTNQNPEITAYLSSYERTGVPIYVYYPSRDLTTNVRPEPIVLPQLLTRGLIEDIVTNN